jgi:hypothetical protein
LPPDQIVSREEAEAEADAMGLDSFGRSIYINLAMGGVGDVIEVTEESERASSRERRTQGD